MEMIKPDTLFCASQPLDWRGTPHQAFSALLGIDLRKGGVLTAEEALAAAMSALPPGCRLDAGIPKQEAEWLLAGTVTPLAREGSVIEIRVGKSRRRFLVKAAPDGKPVPLTWEVAAFDPAGNPLGSKDAPLLADPALPHGAPACPLPLGAWPCRMKGLGTYDARWLQTRWPGLPDDADWHFFNEAQPQQRLPGGLRGDEEIFLSAFGPETPEQHVRLPGVRLRLEVLRTGETEWKGQAIAADTLWLFPVERTALICWHALVPCADEKPSDIAAARFLLSPEQAASAPPPAAPAANVADAHIPAAEQATAAGPSMPGMSAAGMTAAAAATTVAAGAAAASAAKAGTAPDAPGSTPQDAAPAPPPGPAPLSQAELAANLHADLEESLPEFNAVLAQAGLPPLTPEQIAETRQHLARLSAEAAALEASSPPPPLEEQLRQAGLSEERIAAVNAALELELPDPAEYADAAAWQAASEAFLARFSALLQPPASLTDSMSQMLRLMGPGGAESLRAMSGDLPGTPSALLQKAGMSPAAADRLLELLDDAPDDLDALTAYAPVLEAGAGFPPGSVSAHLERYQAALKELEDKAPDKAPATAANKAASAPSADIPAQPAAAPQSAPDATPPEAPAASPAGAAQEPGDDMQPDAAASESAAASAAASPSRAQFAAVLAAGGSLAGFALAGADLSGLRLDGQQLAGADLSGADLRGASLVGTDLRGATLAGADASGACFLRARLSQADLRKLRAPDADFTGADLTEADASEADLSSALFHESRVSDLRAPQARMEGARLRYSDFSGADLSGANLRSADMHALCLDRARLNGADLAGAALGHGTQAPAADFTGAVLSGSAWTEVAAPRAVFRRAAAANASFTDCDFAATDWTAVSARQADLTRCSLQGAALQRADLFEASLREARLHGADARGASLYGADLYRLGLDGNSRLDDADITATILEARQKHA